MIKALTFVFLSSLTVLVAACGSSTPSVEAPAKEAAAADEKPCAPPTTSDAGAATCEPGCVLIQGICKPDRGIIVHQGPGSP